MTVFSAILRRAERNVSLKVCYESTQRHNLETSTFIAVENLWYIFRRPEDSCGLTVNRLTYVLYFSLSIHCRETLRIRIPLNPRAKEPCRGGGGEIKEVSWGSQHSFEYLRPLKKNITPLHPAMHASGG